MENGATYVVELEPFAFIDGPSNAYHYCKKEGCDSLTGKTHNMMPI